MSNQLINTLLDKNLISEGTLVYGKVLTAGLGQNMQYVPMELMILSRKGDNFICRNRLGRSYNIEFSRIEQLDGMDIVRYAAVYNIKADGSAKSQGKKRGRKPKSAQINTIEGDLNGKDQRTKDNHQAEPIGA